MSIKIEEGKYYRTRDGHKVGPVRSVGHKHPFGDHIWARWSTGREIFEIVGVHREDAFHTELVSEWDDTPKRWRDMTDEEKGALLLAVHEGRVIEMASYIPGTSRLAWSECPSTWKPTCTGIYRIKPGPVRETTALYIRTPLHRKIGTIDLIDGEPDCDSIKMEKL